MRRILLLLTTLVAVVSCFEKSTFSQSQKIIASMEFDSYDYSKLFGKDSLYCDTLYKRGISWGPLDFYHSVNKETAEFEGGFILSYLSGLDKTDGLPYNEFRVNVKDSLILRNTYLVFRQTDKMPEHDMGFNLAKSGTLSSCVMNSCFVTNTVAVAEAVKEQFVMGDKLLLKARGYKDGKETGTAEIMLAEKTSARDSIVHSWTAFDLSNLGNVDYVDFEFECPAGKNIPLAVCVDNMIANVAITY